MLERYSVATIEYAYAFYIEPQYLNVEKYLRFFSHFIFTFSWKCILNYLDMYRNPYSINANAIFETLMHTVSQSVSLLGILLYRKIRFNPILMLSFVYDARNMKSGEFSESFGIWATNFISFEFSQCFLDSWQRCIRT